MRRRPGLDHRPQLHRLCAADLGATSFIYEGAPELSRSPTAGGSMVEKYGITILYTAPTAIRGLMRFGEDWPNQHDLSSPAPARLGRRADQPRGVALVLQATSASERCPIMDTWWQTETGGFMITPTPVVPLKPGSGTLPFAGIQADVVRRGRQPGDAERGWLPGRSSTRGRAWRAPSGATPIATAGPTGRLLPRAGTSPATAPARTRTATSGSSAAWTM